MNVVKKMKFKTEGYRTAFVSQEEYENIKELTQHTGPTFVQFFYHDEKGGEYKTAAFWIEKEITEQPDNEPVRILGGFIPE